MRSGRHVARHSNQSQTTATARASSGPKGPGWLAVLGVSAVLVAAGIGFGAKTFRVQLAWGNASPTLFGTSASSLAVLHQDSSQFGHMPVVRIYYPGLPSTNAWTTGLPAAAKSAVVVSFKAQPDAVLSGRDDATLAHFFDTAPTGHPIYYSYYHEPEDNIAAGQFTLSAYKAAWAHIVAIADAAHNPYLRSTLILMAWDLSSRSGRDWKNYLPSGGIITTLGWDAYPAGSVGDKDPHVMAPSTFMSQAVAASKSAGLPFGFAEFGLATAAGRPAWLTDVAGYIRSSGALFGTYFNTSRWISMHLTDAASIQAWRQVVQRSDGVVPSPRPTPDQPAAAPDAPRMTSLTLRPPAFQPVSRNHTTLTFILTRRANVTVCVLNSSGAIVRQLTRPDRAPGRVSIAYYGFNGHGHRVPAGRYTVLAVASNSHGSAAGEAALVISVP